MAGRSGWREVEWEEHDTVECHWQQRWKLQLATRLSVSIIIQVNDKRCTLTAMDMGETRVTSSWSHDGESMPSY